MKFLFCRWWIFFLVTLSLWWLFYLFVGWITACLNDIKLYHIPISLNIIYIYWNGIIQLYHILMLVESLIQPAVTCFGLGLRIPGSTPVRDNDLFIGQSSDSELRFRPQFPPILVDSSSCACLSIFFFMNIHINISLDKS